VHDFPASKDDRDFRFVAPFKKTNDMLQLELIIMLIDFGPNLYFLDLDDSLFFLRLVSPFLLLIRNFP
jgi:hypothetical protein